MRNEYEYLTVYAEAHDMADILLQDCPKLSAGAWQELKMSLFAEKFWDKECRQICEEVLQQGHDEAEATPAEQEERNRKLRRGLAEAKRCR